MLKVSCNCCISLYYLIKISLKQQNVIHLLSNSFIITESRLIDLQLIESTNYFYLNFCFWNHMFIVSDMLTCRYQWSCPKLFAFFVYLKYWVYIYSHIMDKFVSIQRTNWMKWPKIHSSLFFQILLMLTLPNGQLFFSERFIKKKSISAIIGSGNVIFSWIDFKVWLKLFKK